MQDQPVQGMWARYALFIVLSLGILFANYWLMSKFGPQKPPADPAAKQAAQAPEKAKPAAKENKEREAAKPEAEKAPAEVVAAKKAPEQPAVAEPKVPDAWVALGSADPNSPYRMLVTLTSRGAAVKRIELNSQRFHDPEDSSGYLGHVTVDEAAPGPGVPVQVVGDGTPAALAGLKAGDVIQAIDEKPVAGFDGLRAALKKTEPRHSITLTVLRQGNAIQLPVTLGRRPLEVVRPEGSAPASFRMKLYQIDDLTLAAKDDAEAKGNPASLDEELDGAKLLNANWDLVTHNENRAQFSRLLPKYGLEILKTFELAQVPADSQKDGNFPAYHLTCNIEIKNTGKAAHKVSYELDGPNGLPDAGWWYASKVSRTWGGTGLRDVMASFNHGDPDVLAASRIGQDEFGVLHRDDPMTYVGVDAQYFSVMLIPQREDPSELWCSEWQPLYYGKPEKDRLTLTNTSFRVVSTVHELKPGDGLKEQFLIFAGPKKPDLLAQSKYGLSNVLYYGWFKWAAIPMLWILHGVYYVIPNYGIAIILLTVMVRSAMFPISRKQALNAQKMQELQPEIKRIQEKYKDNLEARGKAQQLFRKHKYNPAGGCLLVFLQLPIFVGLYRALMVDVELFQAPLLSRAIGWASNLAAPDMLFDWSGFMFTFVTNGTGMLGLGPYFNLFPVIAILLFLWQQKKMMPPPTDEQSAMQQKIMQYMMIFMGIMFFKVASGLCLYFIASSLWGMGERKFLPKSALASSGTTAPAKKTTGLKLPWGPKPDGRDGAAPRKKRKSGRR